MNEIIVVSIDQLKALITEAVNDAVKEHVIFEKKEQKEPIKLLTIKQVADSLKVSSKTVERLVKKSEIQYVKVGTSTRFEEKDVIHYINKRKFK